MDRDDEEPPLAVQIDGDSSELRKRNEFSEEASVGVTIITGYLGAGKSTVSFRIFSLEIVLHFDGKEFLLR